MSSRAKPALFAAAAAVILGCGTVSERMPGAAANVPPPNQRAYTFDAVARGRVVFENACIRCHGLGAATGSAPAMVEVSRKYREAFFDSTEAAESVAAWIGAPSAHRALLPPGAIDHWKLMPRVALDDDLAMDAGYFVWSLTATPPDTGTARTR